MYDNRTGAKNRPKIPIDNAWGKFWRVVAQSENFVETYESQHLKRLSSCARTYHAMGYKLYPWGARAPQSCPIDLLWWGKSHENTCFSYYGNLHRDFALIITRHHNVIETWGQAHFTQTTNQHLRIIVKLSSHAPSNHLEHLSNTSHRLPLKEIKGISQDRSVIETWGWARLTRGSKQPILNHLNTHWPRPSNPCRAP